MLLVKRRRGIRRRIERFLGAGNGMGVDEQLAGDGDQDDLGWLAGGGHASDEGGQGFVGPFGAEGAHVERAAQALTSNTACFAGPAHGRARTVFLGREAGEGRERFGAELW